MADRDTSNSSDQLRVDIIDVGQGDSILLEGPDETTMLIDSGPRQDHGKTVLEHLDEHDINHLDHLVATHYDADHIGGHADIIESFGSDRIDTVHVPQWEEIEPQDTKTVGRFRSSLLRNDIDVNKIKEGDDLTIDGADVDVLNPSPSVETADRNENSVALQVTHNDQSILLAGDVEGEAEGQMFEQYSDQLSTVDSVKASHHGSYNGTGTTSINGTDPESIFISSSLTNGFLHGSGDNAHPHDEMLKRVHDHEGDIDHYWTAVHGTTSAIVEEDGIRIDPTNERDPLSAADVAALKYYGRDNDLNNEQLAAIEEIDAANLPEMMPEWANEAPIVVSSQTLDETAIEGAALHVSPADATDVDVSFSDGDIAMSLTDEGQTTEGTSVQVSPGDEDLQLSSNDNGTLTVELGEDAGATMQIVPGAEDNADYSFGDDLTLAFDDGEVRVSPGEDDIQLSPGDDGNIQMAVGNGHLTHEPNNDPTTDQETDTASPGGTEDTERGETMEQPPDQTTEGTADGLNTGVATNGSEPNTTDEAENGVEATRANGSDSPSESDIDGLGSDKPGTLPPWMDLEYDGHVSSVDSNSKWMSTNPPEYADPWLTAPERQSTNERANERDHDTETDPQLDDEKKSNRDDDDLTPSSGGSGIG